MPPVFVVNARQKEKFVYRACAGALAQTVPCEVILSDQGSTDGTLAEIERAVREAPRGADHTVRVLHCPVEGPYGMATMNAHMSWIIDQTDAEWIFQSSADDYSLPDRVKVCMEAVAHHPCSAVGCTMFFEKPGETNREAMSGYPKQTGYVPAGEGLTSLAYGSVIGAYKRDFLLKVGSAGDVTPDVFWGYLAALDEGFYVVCNPQHVHVTHAGLDNTGFGGKLLAAQGDESMRLNELNQFQLLQVYFACLEKVQEVHPNGIKQPDYDGLISMIVGHAYGWLKARMVLHNAGVTPGVM